MKKSSKSKNKTLATTRIDPYLEGLMGKLLERLVGIEKKLDAVVVQTAGKPSTTDNQSKPFQSLETKQPSNRDRVMYEAICADCQKVCEVPFRPSEDRPVYCKDCFAKRKSGGSGRINNAPGPVAFPQKPANKPNVPKAAIPLVHEKPKKVKKSLPAKKSKKRK